MRNTLIVMALAALALAVLAFMQGGVPLLGTGVSIGFKMLLEVFPLLVAAFALGGLVQVVINPEKVSALLGKDAGSRGVFLGAAAGGLLPGGPYVYYPVAASFAKSGAEGATLIAFITAKSLWDLSRIPMEVAILGGNITAIRYLVTFVFPIIAGLLARWLYPGLTRHLLNVSEEGVKE